MRVTPLFSPQISALAPGPKQTLQLKQPFFANLSASSQEWFGWEGILKII